MASRLSDTIVAPITGAGKAAVAIIRVSGPDAWRVAATVMPRFRNAESWQALYGDFVTGDDGIALPFRGPKSFTGEDTVELSVHGSPASVRELVNACLAAGCRLADPGEFTYRAFMNGRLDLTAAEGVRETIESLTHAQLRQANRLRDGSLMREVSSLRDELTGVLAAVEASVDFSEEVGELDRTTAAARLDRVAGRLLELCGTASASRVVREGYTVAIVGRPNAGKSSLMNAILRSDRAIVTPIAGTTRDTLEEWVEVSGQMVRLVDTAGLRHSEDVVESEGIARARQAAESADLRWYLFDAAAGWTKEDDDAFRQLAQPIWKVANKVDLSPANTPSDHQVSAATGAGLAALLADLASTLGNLESSMGVNARHEASFQGALEAVGRARNTLEQPLPDDLVAVDVRDAIRWLGEVTGETASEDMLERIFRDFCIGK